MKIVSEGSIGANLRRIVAVTGTGTIERIRHEEEVLGRPPTCCAPSPTSCRPPSSGEIARRKELEDELKALRGRGHAGRRRRARRRQAVDGVVVARRDGVARRSAARSWP